MGNGGATVRRVDLLDGAAGVALVLFGFAAAVLAVRFGAAAGAAGGDLAAELRARAENRILTERAQILPLLEAVARGDREEARREAEAALPRLEGNSQLRLLLARQLRGEGRVGPALREYRRAVELERGYADRRSPLFIGADLEPYLAAIKERVAAGEGGGAALRDLHTLQRFLAGGCT